MNLWEEIRNHSKCFHQKLICPGMICFILWCTLTSSQQWKQGAKFLILLSILRCEMTDSFLYKLCIFLRDVYLLYKSWNRCWYRLVLRKTCLVRFSKLVSKEMLLRRLYLTWYENSIIRVKCTLILVNRSISLNLWLHDSFSILLPLFLLLPKGKPLW